jgi:hypothetical protein
MRLEWEYRIIEVDLDSPRAPQALNNAGRDGWEAITGTTRGSVDPGSARHERLVVLLKRMKPTRSEREQSGAKRKKVLAS